MKKSFHIKQKILTNEVFVKPRFNTKLKFNVFSLKIKSYYNFSYSLKLNCLGKFLFGHYAKFPHLILFYNAVSLFSMLKNF